MSQHDTLTQALQEIADWNSHTTEFAVDYGSNGVRDFYRCIARAALSATQPAQAAQGEPVQGVPDGWEIREDDTWIYFKRPDGFCQAVTPNDPHTSHAQTLHMLMRAMLTASPTPPAQQPSFSGFVQVVGSTEQLQWPEQPTQQGEPT